MCHLKARYRPHLVPHGKYMFRFSVVELSKSFLLKNVCGVQDSELQKALRLASKGFHDKALVGLHQVQRLFS